VQALRVGWLRESPPEAARLHPLRSKRLIPVVLRCGEMVADLVASVDTGASYCLFEGAYAAKPGLDLIAGALTRFRTANGNFEAYGHEVDVEVPGIVSHSLVYFVADPTICKNALSTSRRRATRPRAGDG